MNQILKVQVKAPIQWQAFRTSRAWDIQKDPRSGSAHHRAASPHPGVTELTAKYSQALSQTWQGTRRGHLRHVSEQGVSDPCHWLGDSEKGASIRKSPGWTLFHDLDATIVTSHRHDCQCETNHAEGIRNCSSLRTFWKKMQLWNLFR